MPESFTYIDDNFIKTKDAKISILEPTFTKSDAVYDTVSVLDNQIFRLNDHLERFENSCNKMHINVNYSKKEISNIAAKCLKLSNYKTAIFMLIGRRGPYKDLTKRDPRTCKNGLIVTAIPYYNIFGEEKNKYGLKVFISENKRVPKESINAKVKNFNWMDLNIGLFEAYENKSDTAVLCTPDGNLSEGPGFNIWIIKDGKLKTPKGNVLEGITRKSVKEIAQKLGIKAEEKILKKEDLIFAEEAFTCTTAAGITPIIKVNEQLLGNGHPGLLTEKIKDFYWSSRKKGWHGTHIDSLI